MVEPGSCVSTIHPNIHPNQLGFRDGQILALFYEFPYFNDAFQPHQCLFLLIFAGCMGTLSRWGIRVKAQINVTFISQ